MKVAWCGAGAATLTLAWSGLAQEVGFRVEYAAPDPCPSEAEFLQAIADRSETGRPAAPAEEARLLKIEIADASGTWHGTLQFVNAAGSPVTREVEAPGCSEVADALAIMAALALDSQNLGRAGGGEEEPANAQGALAGRLDLDSAESLDPPPDHAGSARLEHPAVERPAAPRIDRRQSIAPPEQSAPKAPDWELGAALSLRSEISPAFVSPGGELVLWRGEPGGLGFRLALGVAGSGKTTVGGHRASFAWTGGTLDGCQDLGLTEVSGCASLDAGLIAGAGKQDDLIVRAHTKWRSWMAIGPALRWALPASERWSIRVGVAGRYAALRPNFHYAAEPDVTIHRPKPWVFAVTLDVSYSLRDRKTDRMGIGTARSRHE